MKKVNWREISKFLSGAFFVTAGASWYFAWYKVDLPFMGTTMSHEFLAFRGFLHFGLFLLTLYFGFIRKNVTNQCLEFGVPRVPKVNNIG